MSVCGFVSACLCCSLCSKCLTSTHLEILYQSSLRTEIRPDLLCVCKVMKLLFELEVPVFAPASLAIWKNNKHKQQDLTAKTDRI